MIDTEMVKKNARSDKTNKQFVYIFQLRFLLRSARVPILGDVLRQLLVVCPVARQVAAIQN